MALPSSGQLSLGDIAGELGSSTPYSLRDMSDAAGFSSPDSVSDFYGYSAGGVLIEFYITNASGGPYDSCYEDCGTTVAHNGVLALPGIGDTVYTDAFGTTLGAGYYGMSDVKNDGAVTTMEVDKGGEVAEIWFC
jgi:hypothetical protein